MDRRRAEARRRRTQAPTLGFCRTRPWPNTNRPSWGTWLRPSFPRIIGSSTGAREGELSDESLLLPHPVRTRLKAATIPLMVLFFIKRNAVQRSQVTDGASLRLPDFPMKARAGHPGQGRIRRKRLGTPRGGFEKGDAAAL